MLAVLFVILSGMTHAELVKRLLAEQDLKYRDFHASLLPNIEKKSIIGVRVPTMRKIAKEFAENAGKTAATKGAAKGSAKSMPKDVANFLDKLPHKYFEENQVHLFAVERIKDFDECLRRIEQFLPTSTTGPYATANLRRHCSRTKPAFTPRFANG